MLRSYRQLSIIALFFLCYTTQGLLFAQGIVMEVIGNSGGYDAAADGSVSWTVGEALIEYNQNGAGSLSNGFQQDFSGLRSVKIMEAMVPSMVEVIPNPTHRLFVIRNAKGRDLSIADLHGKILISETIASSSQELSLEGFPAGIYIAYLTDHADSKFTSFKIIKY